MILRYPEPKSGELRAETAGFVLDYVELENTADRVACRARLVLDPTAEEREPGDR